MPVHKLYRFTAIAPWGNPFPLDMLRYDRCWPHVEGQINDTLIPMKQRTEQQVRDGVTDWSVDLVGILPPCVPRWQSFGWTVAKLARFDTGNLEKSISNKDAVSRNRLALGHLQFRKESGARPTVGLLDQIEALLDGKEVVWPRVRIVSGRNS